MRVGAPAWPERATSERAEYRRDPATSIELLRARYVRHAFLPHAHPTYALGVIGGGAEGYRYRGEQVVATRGSVVVIAPGELHTGQAAHPGGWTYRMAYPDPRWLEDAHTAQGGRGRPEFARSVIEDPALAQALKLALDSLYQGHDPLAAETRWHEALGLLVGRHAVPARGTVPAARGPVRQVRALLQEEPAQPHTLATLARGVGLSPAHLARAFRTEVGLPPHAYLLGVRVALARSLLHQGLTPAQAAAEAGFADQSHLTRTFKRMIGVTPGAYLAACR